MAKMKFWIKERINPQLKSPYYIFMGQMSVKDARAIEKGTLYGKNIMHGFASEDECLAEIERLERMAQ